MLIPRWRTTVTYFHTGGAGTIPLWANTRIAATSPNAACPAGSRTYGNDNNLYHVTVSQVNRPAWGTAAISRFTQLTFDCDYPGPKVTTTKFVYDTSTGNLTNKLLTASDWLRSKQRRHFYLTDADGADTRKYNTHYATINNNSYILDHPDMVNLTDGTTMSSRKQITPTIRIAALWRPS